MNEDAPLRMILWQYTPCNAYPLLLDKKTGFFCSFIGLYISYAELQTE